MAILILSLSILYRRLPSPKSEQVQAGLPPGGPLRLEAGVAPEGGASQVGTSLARAHRQERLPTGARLAQRAELPARLRRQVPRARLLLQGPLHAPPRQGGDDDRAGGRDTQPGLEEEPTRPTVEHGHARGVGRRAPQARLRLE